MKGPTGANVNTCGPALIAGPTSGDAYVFLGGEDSRIHVFSAITGLPPAGRTDTNNVLRDASGAEFTMNAPVRSNMATFRGRLYALADDVVRSNEDGTTIDTFSLYCFGQP